MHSSLFSILAKFSFSTLTCSLLLFSGCGGPKEEKPASAPSGGTAVAPAAAPKKADAPPIEVDCEKVKKAIKDFQLVGSQISFMSDDGLFEQSRTGVNNALGIIDVAVSRENLQLISQLPDNTENQFMPMLSKEVPFLAEMLDIYEAAIKSGKPFSDGSNLGEKMKKLASDHALSLSTAATESLKLVKCK